MRILIVGFILLLYYPLWAQVTLVPIPHSTQNKKISSIARTEDIAPLKLPFWDDFSYYTDKKPIGALWASYNTVSINDGMAVNPISLKVATFDGYDAFGKPYKSGIDILAKGFADSLVSQPIDLSLVPVEKRNTVYLSFYYQAQGNGERPDSGDKLTIYFKSAQGWEEVDMVDTITPNDFTFKSVSVDAKFFHNKFQFKIRSFGRLSGPYDTWNVDYVYMNVDRFASDYSTPDRAITSPLTSLFQDYRSMPYKHFIKDSTKNLTTPTFGLYNFKEGNNQPLNYFSYDTIIQYQGESTIKSTHPLDSFKSILPSLVGLTYRPAYPITKLPVSNSFDKKSDSVSVQMKIGLTSRDNDANRDYTANYSPLDFRNNDTIRSTYNLSSYYAYDDGEAEYGAGVNQAGAELAYQFDMKTKDQDVLRAINIYFPDFGDQANQIFELRIWKTLSVSPVVLYKKTVPVRRRGEFSTYLLDDGDPVVVQGTFYVGWKQASSVRMDVGYDANTNSGDKIFYNTTGVWTKNTELTGSLIIRPVFGKVSTGPVTEVAKEKGATEIYPNPNEGTFYLPLNAEQISVYDLPGGKIEFQISDQLNAKRVDVNNHSGIFIVRMLIDNQWFSQRVLIKP